MVDHWWNQKLEKIGKQDFVSVLMGELAVRLRVGKKCRTDRDWDYSGHSIM